jgi:hypothetical protein
LFGVAAFLRFCGGRAGVSACGAPPAGVGARAAPPARGGSGGVAPAAPPRKRPRAGADGAPPARGTRLLAPASPLGVETPATPADVAPEVPAPSVVEAPPQGAPPPLAAAAAAAAAAARWCLPEPVIGARRGAGG